MTMLTTPADQSAAVEELTILRDLAHDLHDGLQNVLARLPPHVARRLRPLCRRVDSLTGTEDGLVTLDDAIRMVVAEPAGAT